MRPPGPLPVSAFRAMPLSAAMRLASGLALMRSPETAGAGAAAAGAGAGSGAGSAFAYGAGAAAARGPGAALPVLAYPTSTAIHATTVDTLTLHAPSANTTQAIDST